MISIMTQNTSMHFHKKSQFEKHTLLFPWLNYISYTYGRVSLDVNFK